MTTTYSIHDLVTLRTNVDLPVPDYFEASIDKPDIEVVEGPVDSDVPHSAKKKRKDYWVWRDGDSMIIDYEALNLKLALKDIEGRPRIEFTPRYGSRSRSHINTLSKILIQFKLLEQGYTFVHAGSVTFGDKAALIPAMGSTGKTFTTLSLVDGEGRKFISDDLSIIDGEGSVLCYPDKIGTGPYRLENPDIPELNVNPLISGRLADISLVSIVFGKFPWLYKTKNFEMPERLIADSSELGGVFLITGGREDEAVPLDEDTASVMSLVQHLDTHDLLANFALNYYSYLFGLDLPSRLDRMQSIIRKSFRDVPCFELRSNELESYPELVSEQFVRD